MALLKNTKLEGLSLWRNRIYHHGAEALATGLASNSCIKWLGVIRHVCVRVCVSRHSVVQLGCNCIGDEGVKALSIALISSCWDSKLAWLALGGNQITDKGAQHLAVALSPQRTNGQVVLEEPGT